jgi:hypothetical protein
MSSSAPTACAPCRSTTPTTPMSSTRGRISGPYLPAESDDGDVRRNRTGEGRSCRSTP